MGFGIQVLNTELHFLELMIGVCERVQAQLGSLPWGWTALMHYPMVPICCNGSRLIVYILREKGEAMRVHVIDVPVSFQPCAFQARGSLLSLGITGT